VSWAAILALAAGTYAMKAAGPVLLGGLRLPQRVERIVDLIPAALLAALVAVQTLTHAGDLTLDARAPGVAAAGLAAWRGAPFLVVVAVAMAVTAAMRAAAGA
jgi:branched-subunit amino acid transport protein